MGDTSKSKSTRKGVDTTAGASAAARTFHEFPDEHAGGWEYEGDGHEAVEFFRDNSNSDELIRGMDSEDRNAFRHWTAGRFMGGQQWLGFDNMTAAEQETTRRIDKILDRATLKKGIVVTRLSTPELLFGKGHSTTTLEELQAMKGKEIYAAGSMSTGAAKEGLAISSSTRGKPIEYKIKIPGGSVGAGMWIGDSRINGWGPAQREFITNRDSRFVVGDTKYDSRRKKYVVEITWVGRDEHDYGRRGK